MNKALETRLSRLEASQALASGRTGTTIVFAKGNDTNEQALARHFAACPAEVGKDPLFVRFVSPLATVLAS